jgi:vancomycin resistance protein YoaR
VDEKVLAEAMVPVLDETGRDRVVRVGTRTQRAGFSTAEARRLGIKQVVSDLVTYFPYAEYRNINQGRAAELINGTVLRPGELFSFNRTVGERTKANGFTVGFVITDGVFAEELGGGVSQVATTTYNAAFFAGLKDVEHTPHSFYIDRYPMGREATVAWPTVDLKFRNSTPHGVLIEAWVVPATTSSQGEMHVRMWSTKHWDIRARTSSPYNFTSPSTRYDPTDDCVATTGYRGFDVDVYRTLVKVDSNEVVRRERQHVHYTPADTVICTPQPG